MKKVENNQLGEIFIPVSNRFINTNHLQGHLVKSLAETPHMINQKMYDGSGEELWDPMLSDLIRLSGC